MRVTIKHHDTVETKGLFGTKKNRFQDVSVHIELTHEEQAIVNKYELGDITVFEDDVRWRHPQKDWPLLSNNGVIGVELQNLVSGYKRRLPTVGGAKQFHHDLKTEYLPKIKAVIRANATPAEDEVFEL